MRQLIKFNIQFDKLIAKIVLISLAQQTGSGYFGKKYNREGVNIVMVEARKLYELISIVARRHGLTGLDPSSRHILDVIIERDTRGLRSTARDIIAETDLSRALVYRKLNDLKSLNWISEEWVDFKLCYKTGPQSENYFVALKEAVKPQQT